ncbi:hypothetical protein LTR64_004581 [Lithohypha guttulata]|uniref:uncharacterized protein n=1 Tax=Lithohypha guttulata TaxID=1690604 RepID=UPI002DDE4B29|nr:hypothetical protein LTR51_006121 [Lithohypha guttulata]
MPGMKPLPVSLFFVGAENDTCSDGWMFIDIHYRAVDAKAETYSYGLFIGAGTSSQNQSLWPSIAYNETRLASNDFCGSNSVAHCHESKYTHGHFGPDASATWASTPQYNSLDVEVEAESVNTTYGVDNLNIYTHYFDPSPASSFIVKNHSLTILSDYSLDRDVFYESGSLGLGSASTLLKQLVDIGRISRNVFSIYLGTAYPEAGGTQNGSIVLGGYDAGRLQGAVHKYPQAPNAGPRSSNFKIRVKQMSLSTGDGSSIGMVTDNGFDGHISTNQYAMEMPPYVIKHLADALQGVPAGTPENTLQLAQKFSGNLTVTLDDDYEIVFPSEWISNASEITPFSAATLDTNISVSDGPFVFGTAFLHHLYMTVDYEDSSFYLADAKVYDNYVQPRSLCAGEAPVPLGRPKVNKFVQTGMVGAILGGLIGGVALAWLVFFVIRKRLQYRQSENAIHKMEGGGAAHKKSSLRKRSRFGFSQFGRKKESKDVTFSDVKRVSRDSDSSSAKDVKFTVTDEEKEPGTVGIEMSTLVSDSQKKTTHVTIKGPVSPLTPAMEQPVEHIRKTTFEATLPEPSKFEETYQQSPLPSPFTAQTPRTGNPLLGDFRQQFSTYDDNEDSDLHTTQQKKIHRRSASERLRDSLRLTVNTNTSSSERSNIVGQPVPMARRKPAPLPLKVVGTTAKIGHSKAPMTPLSVRTDVDSNRKHGFLKKLFPPS